MKQSESACEKKTFYENVGKIENLYKPFELKIYIEENVRAWLQKPIQFNKNLFHFNYTNQCTNIKFHIKTLKIAPNLNYYYCIK